MRFLYCLLPLLGSVSLASELASADTCQCSEVRCSGKDAADLCLCMNGRETICKRKCPSYQPTYRPCPKPAPSTSISQYPIPSLQPTPKPVTCECPLVNCLQIWPGGCYCANTAAQNCYDKCGGEPPRLKSCESSEPPSLEPSPEVTCECESIICVQSWPESCYCANAAADACNKKCGEMKMNLQSCPPQTLPTMTTKSRTRNFTRTASSQTSLTPSVPTFTPLPPNTHPICGGGRAGVYQCDEGYACIADPYTPGCGPACDGLGICVEDKMCDGFAGLACEDENQVCHDDPRDDCDPTQGGADCAGLCVTPHRSFGWQIATNNGSRRI